MCTKESGQRVGLALLGAGIFAKNSYAPMLSQLTDCLEVVAVWSRSPEASEALLPVIQEFSKDVRCFHGDAGLTELLALESVQAVAVVLPPQATLQTVARAVAAGKHVLQEKPVASASGPAREQVAAFRASQALLAPEDRVEWFYAENYRFEDVFQEAARFLAQPDGGLGPVLKIDMVVDLPVDEGNRYYASGWRRDDQGCPGGFCSDALVHFVGALRMLTDAAGLGALLSASCDAYHHDPGLPSPDTLSAVLRCGAGTGGGKGCPVSVGVTFACMQMRCSISVVGRNGTLEVVRGGWDGGRDAWVLTHRRRGDATPTKRSFPLVGVAQELRAFAQLASASREAVPAGTAAAVGGWQPVVPLHYPEEGVADLAAVEAMLQSAALGGAPVPIAGAPVAGIV